MSRVDRRTQLVVFGALAIVFVVAFALLRPQVAPLSDEAYVAIAKDTRQGQLYFKNHSAPCSVVRAWNVQVSCDTVSGGGAKSEKFRVYIDPRTSAVIDVEVSFDP
ncbi:MAG TPA: hypothetical protein VJQ09_01405 [Candidatus Limnocylindria bacterium]|nr:hypothetical protein [Candidatus Limnocylindria bacterium]